MKRLALILSTTLPFLSFGNVHAQSILISSNSGSALVNLGSTNSLTYNFGITTLGAQQALAFTNIGIYMSRDSQTTQAFTVSIHGGLGGTGPLLTNYTVAATNVEQGALSLVNVLLTNNIALTNGNYSLRLSTAASTGNAGYNLRVGSLSLLGANGSKLPTNYWVEDTNATGTAGTNIQAAFVLADYQVSTTNVSFGNYRVGSTLATNVTLTNTAPPAVNATNGNVAEQLSTTSTSSNAAFVSGLSTNLLARAGTDPAPATGHIVVRVCG